MESTIQKLLSLKEMESLFDNTDKINIRFYRPLKKVESKKFFDNDKKVVFLIKIRHNEEEEPKDILEDALKNLKEAI